MDKLLGNNQLNVLTTIAMVPTEKIKVKRVNECRLDLPSYHSEGASGFDLSANIDRSVELGHTNHYTVPTGFAFEVPEGYELQIRPRSGLAFKHNVSVSMGTIDSDYRGEVKLNMVNHGRVPYVIMPGDRIAQAVLVPIIRANLIEVEELSKTERGARGFGSTGNK